MKTWYLTQLQKLSSDALLVAANSFIKVSQKDGTVICYENGFLHTIVHTIARSKLRPIEIGKAEQ